MTTTKKLDCTKPHNIIKRHGGKVIKRTEAERALRITRYSFDSDRAAHNAFFEILRWNPDATMMAPGNMLTIYR